MKAGIQCRDNEHTKEKKQKKKIAWRRMRDGWQMANPTGQKVIYVKIEH